MMKKKALRAFCRQGISIIVLIMGVVLVFADLSWGKPDRTYPPYANQIYRHPSPSPGVGEGTGTETSLPRIRSAIRSATSNGNPCPLRTGTESATDCETGTASPL